MGDVLLDICMQKTRQRTRIDFGVRGVANLTGYFHPQACPQCKRVVGTNPTVDPVLWYAHSGCTYTGSPVHQH